MKIESDSAPPTHPPPATAEPSRLTAKTAAYGIVPCPPTEATGPHEPLPPAVTNAVNAFDWAVYGGIGVGATTITSVAAADWVKYGSGKEICEKAAQNIGDSLGKAAGIGAEKGRAVAHSWIITTALMMGGLLFLPIIKAAEDRKPRFVRRLYDWRHGVDSNAEMPKDAAQTEDFQALTRMESMPKQSWLSIVMGRLAGTVGVYGVMGAAAEPLKIAGERTAQEITEALSRSSSEALRKIGRSPRTHRWLDMGFLDVIACGVCSGGMYIYTHMLCPPGKSAPEQAASQEQHKADSTEGLPPPADETAAPRGNKALAPEQFRKAAVEPAAIRHQNTPATLEF